MAMIWLPVLVKVLVSSTVVRQGRPKRDVAGNGTKRTRRRMAQKSVIASQREMLGRPSSQLAHFAEGLMEYPDHGVDLWSCSEIEEDDHTALHGVHVPKGVAGSDRG